MIKKLIYPKKGSTLKVKRIEVYELRKTLTNILNKTKEEKVKDEVNFISIKLKCKNWLGVKKERLYFITINQDNKATVYRAKEGYELTNYHFDRDEYNAVIMWYKNKRE